MPSRHPGIRLPLEIMPTFKIGEGGIGKGGYAVCAPDGTVIARYPPEDVLLVKFADFLRQQEGIDTLWMLERFIRHLKAKNLAWEEDIPIHQPAVHPFHVRYAPPDEDTQRFYLLVRLAKSRLLSNPLVVTPVDPDIVRIFEHIQEGIRKLVGEGHMGRKEGDGSRPEASRPDSTDREVKYLIIDGYRRHAVACAVFLSEARAGSLRGIPTMPSLVLKRSAEASVDPLSAAALSFLFNANDAPDLLDRQPPFIKDALRDLLDYIGFRRTL